MPGRKAKRMNEKCQVMESKEFIIHDSAFCGYACGIGVDGRKTKKEELILFAYRERARPVALPDSQLSSAFTLCSIPLSRMGDFKVDIEICIYGVRRCLHVAKTN